MYKSKGLETKQKFLINLFIAQLVLHQEYDSASDLLLILLRYSFLLTDSPSENNFLKRCVPNHGDISTQNPNGARYLDPKYSRWLSTDPALSSYVEKNYDGPSGGIFNSVNLNLYHYGGNNPIKYVDPDGREPASSHIGLGLKVLSVNPDKMNRDQARAWIMDNIVSDNSIPICQRMYSLGMLGYTEVFDFTGDKVFTSKLAAADCRANNNTISQVKEGKIRPESNELGRFSFDYKTETDLFGAFGGGIGYTWNVESFDKNTNNAKVRIYIEDTFDFNEGHGERTKMAEKLTTLGRKACLSSFKVTGYYYLKVNVGDEAAKKIQEDLKNVE